MAGLLAVTLSCWQRQHIIEEPGCAELPITRGQSRVWLGRPPDDSTSTLLGEVVHSRDDSALSQALVIIRTANDSIQLQTGADGRFRASLKGDTVVRVDVRRIGYDRVLIPALRATREPAAGPHAACAL